MTEKQFNEITEWQKETFKKATPLSKLAHLKQEIEELEIDLRSYEENRRLEFADCFLLLFGAANADGMNYEDVVNCIDEKFQIVKKRQWGEPNKDGVVNHIKQ